jgi:hypothetical protein
VLRRASFRIDSRIASISPSLWLLRLFISAQACALRRPESRMSSHSRYSYSVATLPFLTVGRTLDCSFVWVAPKDDPRGVCEVGGPGGRRQPESDRCRLHGRIAILSGTRLPRPHPPETASLSHPARGETPLVHS